jgi:predicted nucleotide-binding protein
MSIYLEKIKELLNQAENATYRNGELDRIHATAEMLISKAFGSTSNYLIKLSYINYAPFSRKDNYTVQGLEKIYNEGKKKLINLLKVIVHDMEIDLEVNKEENEKQTHSKEAINKGVNETSYKIFIVHGHNNEMKEAVARTIEKQDLEAIILHEQPNKSKTIIEKFEANSDVDFAVVLFSADDMAYSKHGSPDNAHYRARQNVIFELGFFIGALGRERVVVLHEADVIIEIPSDYSGVLYIPYDKKGAWKTDLFRELNACGIPVDANKIL